VVSVSMAFQGRDPRAHPETVLMVMPPRCPRSVSAIEPKRTSEFAIIEAPGFSLKLPEGWRATEVDRRKL